MGHVPFTCTEMFSIMLTTAAAMVNLVRITINADYQRQYNLCSLSKAIQLMLTIKGWQSKAHNTIKGSPPKTRHDNN